MEKVIIIGAGIGGLCSAVRLLHEGYKVTIYEKEDTVGGKVNIKHGNGSTFDLTASILMTPDIYTEIFKSVGKNYEDYFILEKIDPTYKVSYSDNTSYDFYSDLRRMVNTLEDIEKGLSIEYMDFLKSSYKKYILVKDKFLNEPMIDIKEVLNVGSLKYLLKMSPALSVDKYINKKISNKKLKEYLIFQSMYIGENPFTTSNLYTLIPAISHLYGVYHIRGGLYTYIMALEKLIRELGGEIKLSSEVEEIVVENNSVVGVRTNSKIEKANILLCNCDYPYAIKKLLKNKVDEGRYKSNNLEEKKYSCSVFIIYLGLKKEYKSLNIHNMYISENFRESIEAPFKGNIPKDPSLYFYSKSIIDNDIYGECKQTLNIIMRVPNLSYNKIIWDSKRISSTRDAIINQLKKVRGLEDIEENIIYEDYLTPVDLKNRFNSYYGTAFGLSHKLSQTAYLRPHIKSKEIKGLYYIGSSTHPGNGVSVIIDGSKLISNQINKDYRK